MRCYFANEDRPVLSKLIYQQIEEYLDNSFKKDPQQEFGLIETNLGDYVELRLERKSIDRSNKSIFKETISKSANQLNLTGLLLLILSFETKKREVVKRHLPTAACVFGELIRDKKINFDLFESTLYFFAATAFQAKCFTNELCDAILGSLEMVQKLIQHDLDGRFLLYCLGVFEAKFCNDQNIEPLLLFVSLAVKFFVRNAEIYPKKGYSKHSNNVFWMDAKLKKASKDFLGNSQINRIMDSWSFDPIVVLVDNRFDFPVYHDVQTTLGRVETKQAIFTDLFIKFNEIINKTRFSEEKFLILLNDLETRFLFQNKDGNQTGMSRNQTRKNTCALKSFDKIDAKDSQDGLFPNNSIQNSFRNFLKVMTAFSEPVNRADPKYTLAQNYVVLDIFWRLLNSNPINYLFRNVFFSILRIVNSAISISNPKVKILVGKTARVLFKCAENEHEKTNILLDFLISHTSQLISIEGIISIFLNSLKFLTEQKLQLFKIIILNSIVKILRSNLKTGQIFLAIFLTKCQKLRPVLFDEILRTVELILYSDFLEKRQLNNIYAIRILELLSEVSVHKLVFRDLMNNVYTPLFGVWLFKAISSQSSFYSAEILFKRNESTNFFYDPYKILNRVPLIICDFESGKKLELRIQLKSFLDFFKFVDFFKCQNELFLDFFDCAFSGLVVKNGISLFEFILMIKNELLFTSNDSLVLFPFQTSKNLIPYLLKRFQGFFEQFDLKTLQNSEKVQMAKNCFELISLYSSNESLTEGNQKKEGLNLLRCFLYKFMNVAENGNLLENENEGNLSQIFLIQAESIFRFDN